ncbi:bifunctional serine/threonine-protein kinase/formylglycine-generating enzyme family protein [Sorangium sp. So ce1000]|uniref:bifunctional serine/threonine-protein kinase/formylglycine-generating enzyme family protein n=1 Tax=Sorangium sp. So ce1000 TaxID=3133325 RepID=UPI003F5E777A
MKAGNDGATQDARGPQEDTLAADGSGVVRSASPGRREASSQAGLPGRYEDLGPIAGGSFGEVRRARDTVLDRVVAMKLLRAEHAGEPHLRRRFLVEAQITAQLQHPGIVALYDRGELPDGRLWFTMKEVRGRTLHDIITELHASASPAGFRATPSGWTFRRVVDAFARIAQAMAYAHSRGVVHRDLKPDNLMAGEFGEVLVMDWGLARRVGVADAAEGGISGPPDDAGSAALTRHGDIVGTPAYMPPEQARGDTRLHGPASDVYSLGAVLYCLLAGRPPYQGDHAREVLSALLAGPPVPVSDAAAGGPAVPAELAAIVERAMRPAIERRYESAEAMARDVVAWLDGVRRREQALAALEHARAFEPQIAALRAKAATAEARARAVQSELRPFDPIEKKRPAWELEDEAGRLGRAAALVETRWMEAVQGALSLDPDLPEAHAMLADHHRARLIEAELSHRDEDAARAEERLRIHDRGRNAAFLRGDGAVTVVTDPPGAEVIVERFVLEDRRLVPVREGVLGPTPLLEAPLKRGSYLLRIRAAGRAEVRYPVLIERDEHWDGRAPRDERPYPIRMPREGELGADDVYVPAGWCWIGGDAVTPDSLPRRRIWVDALVMRRFPVTTGEYIAFLNDLVATGREAEALAACPRAQLGLAEGGDELALLRDERGLFGLPPDREGLSWRLDWPVVLVDWNASTAYARWLCERTGLPWRLPNELEREKAARGVDGRFLPWGDHVDPTFACVVDTTAGEPTREGVNGHPFDESPYGVRGLAGNTRDWCNNVWKHEGPAIEGDRLQPDAAAPDEPDFLVIKGGAWASTMMYSRAAARFGGRPHVRRPVVGLRVVRRAPGA